MVRSCHKILPKCWIYTENRTKELKRLLFAFLWDDSFYWKIMTSTEPHLIINQIIEISLARFWKSVLHQIKTQARWTSLISFGGKDKTRSTWWSIREDRITKQHFSREFGKVAKIHKNWGWKLTNLHPVFSLSFSCRIIFRHKCCWTEIIKRFTRYSTDLSETLWCLT